MIGRDTPVRFVIVLPPAMLLPVAPFSLPGGPVVTPNQALRVVIW
jgi:hypothetical protein